LGDQINLVDNRKKAISLLTGLYRDSLEERFYKYEPEVKKMLDSEAFVSLNDNPHAVEINTYVSRMMAEQSRNIYEEMKEEAISSVSKNIEEIFDGLFSNDEMGELVAFLSSSLGLKLVRNIDVIRQTFDDASRPINVAILKRWNEPDSAEMIREFIESLGDEDDNDL
jgi:hypothetical protein